MPVNDFEVMMDSKAVNNEVTSMRSEVQRAKVHVINKLVRESRKLKVKKGTDQQREKYGRKADRLAELILHIKKIRKDAVSKFALSNTRNMVEILSDVSLPLEVKSLAHIAANKNIADRVNRFRSQFPNWETELPPLIAKIGSKKCKKKNKEPPLHLVNGEHIYTGNENNVQVNEPGRYVRAPHLSVETESRPEGRFIKSPVSDTEESESEIEDEIRDSEVESRVPSMCTKNGKKGIAEVKRFTDLMNKPNDLGDHLKIKDESKSKAEKKDLPEDSWEQIEIKNEMVHAAMLDPFFVMDDGKEGYLNITSKNESVKNSSALEKCRRQPSVYRNPGFQESPCNFKSLQNKNRNGHHSMNRKERRFQEFHKNKCKTSPFLKETTVKEPEALHPSWEAKRRLKEIQIAPFQGKKIKFEDDE